MEDFIINISIPAFVCGITFLAIGLVMYYNPPKDINGFIGYRTGASMKSQERWDFAQRYCAVLTIKSAAAMLAVSLLCYFIPVDPPIKQFAGIILLIVCAAWLITGTEIAIKQSLKKPDTYGRYF